MHDLYFATWLKWACSFSIDVLPQYGAKFPFSLLKAHIIHVFFSEVGHFIPAGCFHSHTFLVRPVLGRCSRKGAIPTCSFCCKLLLSGWYRKQRPHKFKPKKMLRSPDKLCAATCCANTLYTHSEGKCQQPRPKVDPLQDSMPHWFLFRFITVLLPTALQNTEAGRNRKAWSCEMHGVFLWNNNGSHVCKALPMSSCSAMSWKCHALLCLDESKGKKKKSIWVQTKLTTVYEMSETPVKANGAEFYVRKMD